MRDGPEVSRRGLAGGAAALAALAAMPAPAAALDIDGLGAPLGVQALACRAALTRDFPRALRVLKAMGFGQIELVSFHGYIGNIRGDFAPLAGLAPAEIRARLRQAGLGCASCHFLAPEFEAPAWGRTLDWAKGLGLRHMIFTGAELPARPTLSDLHRHFDQLSAAGEKVRAAGMRMGLHSDAWLWRAVDGRLGVEALIEAVKPEDCQVQMDFASIVQAGADGGAMIDRFGPRLVSIHLRDAKTPADPDAYLPALPLGEGQVDWGAVMRAGRRAGVRDYFVEMQLRPLTGVLDALMASCDYLRQLRI